MDNLGVKLKELRLKSKKTQQEVANILCINRVTYTQYESNKRSPQPDMLKRIADLFNVTTDELLGRGENPKSFTHSDFIKLPILGEIRAGFPTLAEENIIDYEQMPVSWLNGGEYFILKVVGDSMEDARIYNGDKVLVRVQSECENGQIAVVTIDDIEPVATLKRVFFLKDKIELVPENRKYPRVIYDIQQVTIRGIVKKVFFDPV